MDQRTRELALFNLGIDSKLRACDLTSLQVRDICHGDRVAARACVMQRKTQRPVQFETTAPAREAVEAGLSGLARFLGHSSPADDLTVMAVRRAA